MVSVIITDYCTVEATFSYIRHLDDKMKIDFHAVIVDNSGEEKALSYMNEKNVKWLEENFNDKKIYFADMDGREILLVDAGGNGGYAKGNNLGVSVADFCYGVSDFYLFSNNDIILPDGFSIEEMLETFKSDRRIGIVGPNMIMPSGQKQNPRKDMGFVSQMILRDFNSLWLGCRFDKWIWNLDRNAVRGETGWVSGGFMLIQHDAFHEVKGFDENTFLYCEEMIISERMRRKGYSTYYNPDVTVIHLHRGSVPNAKMRKIGRISKRYYYKKYKNIPELALKISDFTNWVAETVYDIHRKIGQENKRH